MSKLVTARFEYVCYDDAGEVKGSSGVLTSYAAPLDQYTNNATASAGTSYGTASVTVGGGSAIPFNVPPGATLTMSAPSTNTVGVACVLNNAVLIPGGSSNSLVMFPCFPGQIVTVPGVLITTGAVSFQAVSSTLQQLSDAAPINLMWSV